jgi:hypothetical protein
LAEYRAILSQPGGKEKQNSGAKETVLREKRRIFPRLRQSRVFLL